MPRKSQPPRLWLRKTGYWYILDRGRQISTGCLSAETDAAAQALQDHIASRHQSTVGGRDPAKLAIADVLSWYEAGRCPAGFDDEPQPTAPAHDPQLYQRHAELRRRHGELNDFLGDRKVIAITGELCRAYVKHRGRQTAARRELEDLRAAVRAYHKEFVLSVVPQVTLPAKPAPRERWATRQEAARLLGAALGFVWDPARNRWSGKRRDPLTRKLRRHAARYILLGLYSGRRDATLRRTQWFPNTVAPWIDLDAWVYHGRGRDEPATKKRRPPAKVAYRLRPHLARWARMDAALGERIGAPVRHVIHAPDGRAIRGKIRTAWDGILADAGLGSEIVRHTLKHTAATWLMQAGIDLWDAAGFLGVTVETLEQTYGHHHPEFQESAAAGFGGRQAKGTAYGSGGMTIVSDAKR